MKHISFLALILTFFFINQTIVYSEDLSTNIMRRVNAANLELDKADEQIRTGKSEHAPAKIKSARQEYDNIFNYYKGTFDPNHPVLVNLKDRMDKIESLLSTNSSAPKSVDEVDKTEKSKDLSANIRRRIKSADIQLNWVNQRAAKGERDLGSLNTAKSEYKKIFEYYKGSFDPDHPEIIALKNRIDAAEKAMKKGFARKNATAPLESNSAAVEDLPEKMGDDLVDIAVSLNMLEQRLDTASKSSFPGSYVYGVNDDLNIVLSKFKKFNETYKGQFDSGHVAYRQIETRIKKGQDAVSELESRAGSDK